MNNLINGIKSKEYIRERKCIALMISSFQPNEDASNILRTALDSILRFKREDSCVWVIDVGSPKSDYLVTPEEYPSINFVITDYIPKSWESTPLYKRIPKIILGQAPPRAGSNANAWTLDYGMLTFKKINYSPEYLMTLQMDIMFTHKNFLDSLLQLFTEKTAAVGVLKQFNLSKKFEILHSLGCLWKYNILLNYDLSFRTQLPNYDVSELAMKFVFDKGYNIKALRNSYNDPDVLEIIDAKFKDIGKGVDRAIDNNGRVVFMHLGRGILKSNKSYYKPDRATSDTWFHWYKSNLSED